MEHSPRVCVCVCVGGGVLPGKGIIRGRGFENDSPPTKTYNVLKMLADRNYTMFFNIENDYYRWQFSSKPFEIWAFTIKIRKFDEICTDKT